MIISISAGHSKSGVGVGAIGLINESTENRVVKNAVVKFLKAAGHTVHDCTIDTFTDANKGVRDIVTKHNNTTRDLDVQIHFNSGAKDTTGNDKTTGSEVLVYSSSTSANTQAKRVCANLADVGFVNRGVKVRNDLWFLRKTEKPAILIETCFVDDADDVALYKASIDKVARAIAEGIVNESLTVVNESKTSVTNVNITVTRPVVSYDDSNDSVKTIQRLLNVYLNYDLDVDGVFGKLTLAAVKKFQNKVKIDVDGVVGKDTWTNLFNVI